ncbi:MAG: hypothetical protein LBJ89_01970 [Holosporales bacterium]|jgi:hypothetical protein|nr:hypothetical protein [Holosporales bacterium]
MRLRFCVIALLFANIGFANAGFASLGSGQKYGTGLESIRSAYVRANVEVSMMATNIESIKLGRTPISSCPSFELINENARLKGRTRLLNRYGKEFVSTRALRKIVDIATDRFNLAKIKRTEKRIEAALYLWINKHYNIIYPEIDTILDEANSALVPPNQPLAAAQASAPFRLPSILIFDGLLQRPRASS